MGGWDDLAGQNGSDEVIGESCWDEMLAEGLERMVGTRW
jgi:hypothetical protein